MTDSCSVPPTAGDVGVDGVRSPCVDGAAATRVVEFDMAAVDWRALELTRLIHMGALILEGSRHATARTVEKRLGSEPTPRTPVVLPLPSMPPSIAPPPPIAPSPSAVPPPADLPASIDATCLRRTS